MTIAAIPAETAEAVFATLPPIFRDCVDPESSRYSLGLPFAEGGHVYATNGRICVRVPADAFPDAAAALAGLEARKTPRASDIYSPLEGDPGVEAALPAVPGPVPCSRCMGGQVRPRCECCNQELPGCDSCGGTGTHWGCTLRVPVAPGVDLGHRCGHVLQALGVAIVRHRGPNRPVTFSLGRVEGVLMPLTPEKESKQR